MNISRDGFSVIAGPCAAESREQMLETARAAADGGAAMLRAGAWKPRTSPHSFQGLGEEGLRMLAEAGEATGLPVVTELVDVRHLDLVAEVADVIQIGARNMQNFVAAHRGRQGRAAGAAQARARRPPWRSCCSAAEYVTCEGNDDVILCERGIRTFEGSYRYTLDLAAVPVLKERCDLPVIVDPSHAAGRRELVEPLSLAAAAVGADGVMVEIHPDPDEALCDGPQSLHTADFAGFCERVRAAAREPVAA